LCRTHLAAFALLVLLVPAGAGAGAAQTWQPAHEQAAKGIVSASLDYERSGDYAGRNMRLRITRRGKVVFDKLVCRVTGCIPALGQGRRAHALVLRDVAGSAEPEVLVETHWGGVHCCHQSVIASRGQSGYRWIRRTWGDIRYHGDRHGGVYYFLGLDPAFSGAFASEADSTWPAQVWTLTTAGRLRDVTRERLDYVRRNASDQMRWYRQYRGKRSVRGILASWCADQYLLGQRARCDVRLERTAGQGWLNVPGYDDPGSSAEDYIAYLAGFLVEHGYYAG
jgi:hypothetical protein